MKPMKIFGGVFIVLVIVVIIAIFIGLKNLNSLVEMAIESVGSDVAKTQVSVGKVDIDITDGRGKITRLTIGNPPGYETENAVQLNSITLHIDPSSLAKPVVVIKELNIDGAILTAEHKGLADINLQQLYDNMHKASDKPETRGAPTTARPNLRFMLEKVSFTNISMNLISSEYGQRQLALKDIQLNNLGDKETGLTAEEMANALLIPVVKAARKKAEDELRRKATSELNDKLQEELSDDDQKKLDAVKSWLDK